MNACDKAGRWEQALQLLDEMERKRIEPSAATYSAVISACRRGGQWERILDLWAEMKQQHRTQVTTAATYGAVIEACERARFWEHALRLLGVMQHKQIRPEVGTYEAAIS